MFLQAVPPPVPPPPPPGLPLENEMILLVLGIIYGAIVLYKRNLEVKSVRRGDFKRKRSSIKTVRLYT